MLDKHNTLSLVFLVNRYYTYLPFFHSLNNIKLSMNTFSLVFLLVPNLQYSSVASTTQVQTDLETGARGMYAPGPRALWVST